MRELLKAITDSELKEVLDIAGGKPLDPTRIEEAHARRDWKMTMQSRSVEGIIDPDVRRRIEGDFSGDFEAAIYFHGYLKRNAETARVLREMKGMIRRFEQYAPPMGVLACIDGRMHGSEGLGYPPTTVKPIRTDGAIIEMEEPNDPFWTDINTLLASAPENGRLKPPVFIAFAHRSELDHGCARHGENDGKALTTVARQIRPIREIKGNQLYAVHGMVNTDDLSQTIVFPDGKKIDASTIIRQVWGNAPSGSIHPEAVFTSGFLNSRVADADIDRLLKQQTPASVFGSPCPVYTDLKTRIAIKTHLIEAITKEVDQRVDDSSFQSKVVHPDVFDRVVATLQGVEGLPRTLFGPFAYQIIWNIAYALHLRRRISNMTPEERKKYLGHGEEIIGYGRGYETVDRGVMVLVQRGSGDVHSTLATAKDVMVGNRSRLAAKPRHPILVHANREISSEPHDWDSFNPMVVAELQTMLGEIKRVFGDDVRVLTTYSLRNQKQFIPIQITGSGLGAPDLAHLTPYPIDVIRNLSGQRRFSAGILAENVETLTGQLLNG